MDRIVNGEWTEFVDWLDTAGRVINASDGGILFAEGKYHWYGQVLGEGGFASEGRGGQVTSVGVAMYASEDLYHWEYEGVILACGEGELKAPMRFERPKILYNEATKEYVLWCHYVACPGDHGTAPGTGEVGVAVASKVNGPYRWLGHFRPIDGDGVVRDLTVFRDGDGTAYLIYDRDVSHLRRDDRCLYAVKLTEDYRSCTDEYARLDVCYRREAPAIVKHGGYYHMITSGLTGWAFNAARAYRATSLFGPWEDVGDPCLGDDGTTFASQTTYIFQIEGTDTFVHMGERHNTESFLHCSYIWLPVTFTPENTLTLSYRKEWHLPT